MKILSFILSIFIFSLLLFTCKNSTSKKNFYVSKSYFSLSEKEKIILEKNKTEKLYVNFYTIVINKKKPIPLNLITGENFPKNKKIIPIIHIKKEVLKDLNHLNIDTLVNRISLLNNQIYKIKKIRSLELVLDYNWDLETKDNYNYFIRKLNQLTNQKISIYIRPQQLNYDDFPSLAESGLFLNDKIKLSYSNDLFNENSNLSKKIKKSNYINRFLVSTESLYLKKNKSQKFISIDFLNDSEFIKNSKKINSNLYISKNTFRLDNYLINKNDSLIIKNITSSQKEIFSKFLINNYSTKEIIFKDIN